MGLVPEASVLSSTDGFDFQLPGSKISTFQSYPEMNSGVKVAGKGRWNPTSREKRARYGAPVVPWSRESHLSFRRLDRVLILKAAHCGCWANVGAPVRFPSALLRLVRRFSKSHRWAAPIFFGPRTLWRTWGTRPIASDPVTVQTQLVED